MQNLQKLYVMGHPVAHSKSPVMHNALYHKLGLNWEYGKADFPEESQAQAFLDKRDFLGINITTPYKPLALSAASWVHPLAQLAGGANVLINKQGVLHAYNTDGMGCVHYLKSQGAPFVGAKVVVCGTGPTSFSIAGAAVMAGAQVLVLGRDADKAQRAVRDWLTSYECACKEEGACRQTSEHAVSETACSFMKNAGAASFDGNHGMLSMCGGGYQECMRNIAAADVIIDATPLGMKVGDPAPFDTTLLHEGQWVFDAVYGHGETALAAAAKAAGCYFRSGEGMLVGQAVLAAQLFLEAASVEDTQGFERMASIMHNAAFANL